MSNCNEDGFAAKVMALPDDLGALPALRDEVVAAHAETLIKASQVEADRVTVVNAKGVVLLAQTDVTAMRDAVFLAKQSVDASELSVATDRNVVESLLVEARIVDLDVHNNATAAEAAATRAEAVVIPTAATYSIESINEGQMVMLNMILANKADLERIVIGGLNG